MAEATGRSGHAPGERFSAGRNSKRELTLVVTVAASEGYANPAVLTSTAVDVQRRPQAEASGWAPVLRPMGGGRRLRRADRASERPGSGVGRLVDVVRANQIRRPMISSQRDQRAGRAA